MFDPLPLFSLIGGAPMTEFELLLELVSKVSDLLFLLRVSLIMGGCLCGFLAALLVFEFLKYRRLL